MTDEHVVKPDSTPPVQAVQETFEQAVSLDQAMPASGVSVKLKGQLEQNIPLNTEPWERALANISLSQKTVVEFGSGSGTLTRLIKAKQPKHLITYEIDTESTPADLRSRTDLREVDFTRVEHPYFHNRDTCLIASPPSSELGYIRAEIIDRYNIDNVLLLVPDRVVTLFPDFRLLGTVTGSQFAPARNDQCSIIARGFLEEPNAVPESLVEKARAAGIAMEGTPSDAELISRLTIDVSRELLTPRPDQKFGSSRRVVLCMTDNPHKIPEISSSLSRYGVETYQVPPLEEHSFIRSLLELDIPGVKIKAVVKEQTLLNRHGTHEAAELRDMDAVDHVSLLTCYKNDNPDAAIRRTDYGYVTEGYIDLDKRRDHAVFGWDDVFVVRNLQQSYQELIERGNKISSRDMVFSLYLRDNIYYRKHVDLRDSPVEQEQTVSFEASVRDFIDNSEYLCNPVADTLGVTSLFRHAADQGVFFRSPINRREKNYWLPGLNAGIPLTPKQDPIHEITYMAHDLGHMLIPDLMVTKPMDAKEKQVYTAYRMLSEAMTLVVADMLFVDTLVKSGVEYNFGTRKIYPLFQECNTPLSPETFEDSLRTLLRANAQYCVRGDASGYDALLGDTTQSEAFQAFKTKYDPFFVEDFRWTVKNADYLSSQASGLANWWDSVSGIAVAHNLGLTTVSELAGNLPDDPDELVEALVNRILAERIAPCFSESLQPMSEEERRSKGFVRYMLGQSGIFFHNDFVPETRAYRDKILSRLSDVCTPLSLPEIESMRSFYSQYVDVLASKNVIQLDDAETYKQVYPLFEPFYVFYDESKGFYEDLRAMSEKHLRITV